jgi:hypothetical protein
MSDFDETKFYEIMFRQFKSANNSVRCQELEAFITESIKAGQLEILEKVRPNNHTGPGINMNRKIDKEIARLNEAQK